ncbi:hypothetical protein ACFLW2_03335 [Chloroflexota bacterium]
MTILRDNEILVRRTAGLSSHSEGDLPGKTGVGVVEERGDQIRDCAIGDRVAWTGVVAQDTATVQEHLFVRVPDGIDDNVALYTGVVGYAFQAIRASDLTFGEQVMVSGNGLIASVVSRAVSIFGLRLLSLSAINKGEHIDGIFVCPGEHNIADAAGYLRPKATVVVLGQADIALLLAGLEDKKITLVYPGEPGPEAAGVCHPRAYMRWTVRDDMELFFKLLMENRISVEGLRG